MCFVSTLLDFQFSVTGYIVLQLCDSVYILYASVHMCVCIYFSIVSANHLVCGETRL
jgi:hypothetical protein